MKKVSFCMVVLFFVLFFSSYLYAANIYVDKTLSGNITNGTYSTLNRDNSGSDGDAYTTVQAAINAMNPGDHILMRGGTYREGHIDIPLSKNGTSWKEGDYNKLSSYPGEWAILDAQHTAPDGEPVYGAVLGHAVYDDSNSFDLKYWWFERFEITGGGNSVGGAGFFGAGGPFKFRYMYIHDNYSPSGGQNPAGIKGHHWHDSLVEYCYFNNNGMQTGTNNNAANIAIYSDYNWSYTAKNGYNNNDMNHRPIARNIIRYNYFKNGVVGFKHKGGQLFSGRNPSGGHGWDDTYDTYGDKIHHNIFDGMRAYAIGANQDFAQVYNNIIINCDKGIMIQYEPAYPFYKVVTYNNTIFKTNAEPFIRYVSDTFSFEPRDYYGWDFNNIFDQGSSYWSYYNARSLNVALVGSSGPIYNLSNYTASNNYFYRPQSSEVIVLDNKTFSASAFEAQTLTHRPRIAYQNAYVSSDPLFEGTTGAARLITRGTHSLGSGVTISNGGIGISHPYLAGVTIPSYVGATNPDDHAWVAGVLGLANVQNLIHGGEGAPDWIEGSSNVSGAAPSIPQTPVGFKQGAK